MEGIFVGASHGHGKAPSPYLFLSVLCSGLKDKEMKSAIIGTSDCLKDGNVLATPFLLPMFIACRLPPTLHNKNASKCKLFLKHPYTRQTYNAFIQSTVYKRINNGINICKICVAQFKITLIWSHSKGRLTRGTLQAIKSFIWVSYSAFESRRYTFLLYW